MSRALDAQEAASAPAPAEVASPAHSMPAAQLAAVELASGRTFSGYVDARTGGDTLWLRFEYGRATLWRPIDWSRVVSASVGAKQYDASEFRKAAASLATPAQLPAWEQPPESQSEPLAGNNYSSEHIGGGTTDSSRRPRSLDAAARVGNWDADADDDGLVVHVAPRDGDGRITAAGGTLSAELIGVRGQRRPTPNGVAYGPNDQRPVLGTWSVQLTPAQIGDRGAVVRLPFSGVNPAERLDLGNLGALRLKFSAPGADLLETLLDPIRLREIGQIGEAGKLWP
jgi:hypothetical protein